MFTSICTTVITQRAEKISTPLGGCLLRTVLPEHVLMSHRAHCYAAKLPLCRRLCSVKNINHIVPAACRFAVMVEHSIELVMRWI
jgi:hypothetical protein